MGAALEEEIALRTTAEEDAVEVREALTASRAALAAAREAGALSDRLGAERAAAVDVTNTALADARATIALNLAALEAARAMGAANHARAEAAEADAARARASAERGETTVAAAMATFGSATEGLRERERDVTARLEIAARERDAAREEAASARSAAVIVGERAAGAERDAAVAVSRALAAESGRVEEAAAAARDRVSLETAVTAAAVASSSFAATLADDAQRIAVLAGKLIDAEERARASGEQETALRAAAAVAAAREVDAAAARDRNEMLLAGLASELRSWKESVGAGADATRNRLADANRELAELSVRSRGVDEARAIAAAAVAEAAGLRDALFRAEADRRRLHNVVAQLRGAVRVMVRVRPPSRMEEDGGLAIATSVLEPGILTLAPPMPSKDAKGGAPGAASAKAGKPLVFSFDHVFGAGDGQSAVFEEVSQLVQSGELAQQ